MRPPAPEDLARWACPGPVGVAAREALGTAWGPHPCQHSPGRRASRSSAPSLCRCSLKDQAKHVFRCPNAGEANHSSHPTSSEGLPWRPPSFQGGFWASATPDRDVESISGRNLLPQPCGAVTTTPLAVGQQGAPHLSPSPARKFQAPQVIFLLVFLCFSG